MQDGVWGGKEGTGRGKADQAGGLHVYSCPSSPMLEWASGNWHGGDTCMIEKMTK